MTYDDAWIPYDSAVVYDTPGSMDQGVDSVTGTDAVAGSSSGSDATAGHVTGSDA